MLPENSTSLFSLEFDMTKKYKYTKVVVKSYSNRYEGTARQKSPFKKWNVRRKLKNATNKAFHAGIKKGDLEEKKRSEKAQALLKRKETATEKRKGRKKTKRRLRRVKIAYKKQLKTEVVGTPQKDLTSSTFESPAKRNRLLKEYGYNEDAVTKLNSPEVVINYK